MSTGDHGKGKPSTKLSSFSDLKEPGKIKLNFKGAIFSTKGGGANSHIPTHLAADEGKFHFAFPMSTTSPFFAIMKEGTGEVSSLIAKYNILPKGLSHYKTQESKKSVLGFSFMEAIEHFERAMCAQLDACKDKTQILSRSGVNLQKLDLKKPFYESGFFTKSIIQPTHGEYQGNPELIGYEDHSKSPIMSLNLWMGEVKYDPMTNEPTNIGTAIPITNQRNVIYSQILDFTNGIGNQRLISEWDHLKQLMLYFKGSSKNGSGSFFELTTAIEVLNPSLFINGKEAKFQYKVKACHVFMKKEIIRSVGPTPEEQMQGYNEFLQYASENIEPEVFTQQQSINANNNTHNNPSSSSSSSSNTNNTTTTSTNESTITQHQPEDDEWENQSKVIPNQEDGEISSHEEEDDAKDAERSSVVATNAVNNGKLSQGLKPLVSGMKRPLQLESTLAMLPNKKQKNQ
jgi:hypothetical protein